MGTKNNPGEFDCYSEAEPDEPVFVLLGRDPGAADLVLRWALRREHAGERWEKVAEARSCAEAMLAWCRKLDKAPLPSTFYQVRQSDYASMDALARKIITLSEDLLNPCFAGGPHNDMVTELAALSRAHIEELARAFLRLSARRK